MGNLISSFIQSQGLNAPGTVYSDANQETYNNEVLKHVAASLEQNYGTRDTSIGYDLTPLGDLKKYNKLGIKPSIQLLKEQENGSLDKLLAETQSAGSKFMHALEQAVVSEVGLGTLLGVSDLLDRIGQTVGSSDHDYSNPVSRKLEEWQEKFNNEVAPIYTTPGVDISNGGLLDAGWWASNIPSVMSSLTLLLPATGGTKALGYIGKGLKKVGQAVAASNAARITASSAKWAARATKLSELSAAQKAYAGLKDITQLSTGTKATLGRFAETGTTALLSRTMENYQEARQTYDDMYEHASESINKMKPEEYDNFLRRNAHFLEGVDTNNKDEVAKAVARNSADRTFAMDFANIGFDILQLYALRNMTFKGVRNLPSRAATRRAHLNSIKYAGMNDAEIAAERAKMSLWDKTKETIGDRLYGGALAINAQLSEGVEEAVNYVAQQDGMTLGHVMLGEADKTTFSRRLAEYAKAPGLWESAFWGLMGGIVFQELGSGFNRAQNAISAYNRRKRYDENKKTKEKVDKQPWDELWENPETKRRVADINKRKASLQEFLNQLDMIENKGLNPFQRDEKGQNLSISENEKSLLKEQAYNKMLKDMTLRALDSGNYDLLKEYLSSDEVKKVIVNSGAISEADATRYQQQAIANMEAIEKQYDENVMHLNSLTKYLNANRKEPIPVEYIQIIARNNIEHQLQIKDWEAQLAAWEIQGNEQQQFFKDKLDPNVDYKSAVRLVMLTNQLGRLENDKKKLLVDKETINTVAGQQELDYLNNQINGIRDIIYNLEPDNAVGNLLFAISNAMNYEVKNGTPIHNVLNEDYITFRENIVELETTEDAKAIERIDKYLAEIDPRLAKTSKDDTMRHRLIDDNIRRAYKDKQGLVEISKDLHDTFLTIADLQASIAVERKNIKLTQDEVLNEVNSIHNFLNVARRQAIEDAAKTIQGLADTYGGETVRQALYTRYTDDTIRDDYFGTDEKAKADAIVFNNALDILNLKSAANKSLGVEIEALLKLHDAVSAAQGENSSTSEEAISATQNEQVNNSSAKQQESNIEQKEQEKQTIPQSETPLQTETQTSQNGVVQLEQNGEVYGTLTPNTEQEGTYLLDVIRDNPFGISYLNNPDFYNKNGVSLTEDYIIGEKPVVKREKDGSLTPVKKGVIVKASEDNIAKEEEKQVAQAEAEAASPSSTGGRVQTEIPIAPIPKSTPVAVQEEAIPYKTQTPAEEISNTASDEIAKIVSTAIKKQSAIDWESLREEILNKYLPTDENRADTERLIDTTIRSLKGVYNRKMANKSNSVDDVLILNASIKERNTSPQLLSDFHKAIDKLVEKYIKDVAADKIDGKYYVRLEDLLRYCNSVTESKTTANLLYNNFLNYMQSSDKYIIIDTSLEDALNNAAQPARTILNQVSKRDGLYGINFEGLISQYETLGLINEVKKLVEVINNLRPGDKIAYKSDNNGVTFSVNGVTIGNLPLPKSANIPIKGVKNIGQRWQYNDGWCTDVLNVGGEIKSEFKNLLKRWVLTRNNDAIKALNDIITRVAFDKKLSKTDLNKLAAELEKNVEFVKAKQDGFISSDASTITLMKGLAKLWGYTHQTGLTEKETMDLRNQAIDKWFENEVNPSFEMVESLYSSKQGNVIVGEISDGELIRLDKKDAKPVSNAIGEKHRKDIKLAAAESIGVLTVAGKGINGQTKLPFSGIGGSVSRGSTVVVIPAKSGRHGYVHAFSQPLNSSQFGTKAKEVIDAIMTEFDRIGKEGTPQEICDNLENFVKQLIQSRYNTSITPLFHIKGSGLDKTVVNGNKIGFVILYYDKNNAEHNIRISYKTPNNISRSKGLGIQIDNNSVIEDTNEAIKTLKSVIYDNSNFFLDFNFINSDNNTRLQLEGLAKRDKDNGKFIIEVGERTFTFDSYNDFILDNDIVSLTTEPFIDGTNYRKGDAVGNILAKQVLKVKLEPSSYSPVRESNNKPIEAKQSSVSKILEILNDEANRKDVGKRIAKIVFGEKVKNVKIDNIIFDIFPQNVKFVDENIGVIARTNAGNKDIPVSKDSKVTFEPGQVVVGKEWLELLNGTISDRQQAIRKLAHEQLHLVLHTGDNKKYIEQIRDIFNEFVAKNTNKDLEKYYYKSNPEQEAEYWKDDKLAVRGLEEFLVETLTSKELAAALNSIKTEETVNGKPVKQSLLQRIMNRLAEIFGWKIEKGSLYEKEFNLLRDIFEESKQESATTETTVQVSSQAESNFDEPVTEQKIEQEEEIKAEDAETDDMEFEDDDMFNSAIVETKSTYSSIPAYVDTLPLSQQVDMIEKIEKGEIQTQCK